MQKKRIFKVMVNVTLILPKLKVVSFSHQINQAILPGQFSLYFPKTIIDSSKNGRCIIPFKKFGILRVKM